MLKMVRYDANTVHPSIWKRIYDMDGAFDQGVRIGEQQAMQKASPADWTRIFGPELLRTTGLGTVAMVLVLLGLSTAGRDMQGLMMVIGVGWSAYIIGAMKGKLGARTPSYSASSLTVVAQEAKLDEAESAYVNTLIAISESAAVAASDRTEAIKDLNRLMDEYQRLQSMKRTLPRSTEAITKLRDDALTVQQHLREVTDPNTAETLTHSLNIINQRIAKAATSRELGERIDAESMLLTQLLGQLGDSMQAERSISFDFSDLRDRLASISSRTDETERARAELDG